MGFKLTPPFPGQGASKPHAYPNGKEVEVEGVAFTVLKVELEPGIAGEANNDGTIFVDKNIPDNSIVVDNAGIFEVSRNDTDGPFYVIWLQNALCDTDAKVTQAAKTAGVRSQHLTVKKIDGCLNRWWVSQVRKKDRLKPKSLSFIFLIAFQTTPKKKDLSLLSIYSMRKSLKLS